MPREHTFKIAVSQRPRAAHTIFHKFMEKIPVTETVRVYAVGGDGILFDCLNAIIDYPNTQLAAIPYGTTNDYIRSIGEGLKPVFRDIPRQMSARMLETDLLDCGGMMAMNMVMVGIEAYALQEVYRAVTAISPSQQSRIFGLLSVMSGAKVMFDKDVMAREYTCLVDGEPRTGKYSNISVINAGYYGGVFFSNKHATPDDGYLHVVFCNETSPYRLIPAILKYTRGGFEAYPNMFEYVKCREIQIQSDHAFPAGIDGEQFWTSGLHIRNIKGAIRFADPTGLGYRRRDTSVS
jgi:diacylglycerol kinase family enzyme